ncbi:hypothetical protein EXIGLDRAFT_362372 [Exidia glandulosa HHB12029]|uniref:SAP domain-containing protein n=1 Tax=Exidia glandulosa HHB12029 TaxID=1314781 RepID=A0A165L9F9_EXIGL|nr:hypothetical protein EXIGLDRAFT_362372 [Exidia glandulosa HHB12029]
MERRFDDAFIDTRTRRELQALCKSNGLYGKGSDLALRERLQGLKGSGHDGQVPKITMPSKRPGSAKTASKKASGRRGVRAQARAHDDGEPQDVLMEDASPFALGVQVFSLLAAALGGQDAMDIDVPAIYAKKASQHERVSQPSLSPQATSAPPDESDGNMLLVIARTPRLAQQQQLPPSSDSIPSVTSPTLPTTSHFAAVTGSERVAADDVSPQTEELVAGAAELQPEQQPSPSSNSIPSVTSTPLPATSHVGAATGSELVAADGASRVLATRRTPYSSVTPPRPLAPD